MDRAPLVSAITIFLGAEKFIQDAIESVLAQTHTDWELLLVDDGSSDSSTAISRRYARQHPQNIRYLEHSGHRNQGMAASRNLGIQHCRGKYVGFLDADDVWLPQKLEQQVRILESHVGAAMVYGRTQIWYSWTNEPGDRDLDYFYDLGVEPNRLVEPPTLLLLLLENRCQTPTTCNVLIRRTVFDTVGRFEETFRSSYEDQTFFAKVNLNAPIFVSDEFWAKYRQHPDSWSAHTAREPYLVARRPFLDWLGKYLAEQNVQDHTVWKAFRRERWKCYHPRLSALLGWLQSRLGVKE